MGIPQSTRTEVRERDDYTCQKCGYHSEQPARLEIHHIRPRKHGGSDDPENLVLLCKRCHRFAPGHNAPTDDHHELFKVYVSTGRNPFRDLLWFGAVAGKDAENRDNLSRDGPELIDFALSGKEEEATNPAYEWLLAAEVADYDPVMEFLR